MAIETESGDVRGAGCGQSRSPRGPRSRYDHRKAVRVLSWVFAAGVLVSIVHYGDNYLNYVDYPQPAGGLNPPPNAILGAWILLTTAGVAGYLLFRRAPSNLAVALVAVYSGSGVVGIAHYLVPGAISMPWWRQAHVAADIACGLALLSFAVWAVLVRDSNDVRAPRSRS